MFWLQKDFTIGLADPVKDYQRLIETQVQVDEVVDDDVTKENFRRTAAAAREAVWQLLFVDTSAADESRQKKAADLLEQYRSDACFYDPWPYNEWIVKLRDEILKRELLGFWRESIVKNQLGPCWSRDCDLFDGDDEPPLEFYAHAGCSAPFAASLKVRAALEHQASLEPASQEPSTPGELTPDQTAALTGQFEAVLTKKNPLEEYRTLMKRFVLVNIIVPDDVHKASVDKISAAARDIIWKLLFDGTPSKEDQEKAAELLQEYKGDAGFYSPWGFNEWIVTLRDEVLKRELLDFWREKMVKLELGPSCSRDSDYFDLDDPLPLTFYEKAGCKAPFNAVSED